MNERESLLDSLRHRGRAGIPGGFQEGMEECFPTDGSEWGIVLSERELELLTGVVEAAMEHVRTRRENVGPSAWPALVGAVARIEVGDDV